MTRNRFPATWIISLTVLLALAFFVYWPGLRGGFLFDDFGNLPALGATGPVDNWPTFWRYVTSGTADPTGRPLPLLTFLVDAHNWPADPFPFKRTNLILHLLNGALLTCLLRRLGQMVFTHIDQRRIDMAALFGAAFWLLHPLFLSTTLYIVQREAMLPATFTLLGLLSWLHGRDALLQGRTLTGTFWVAWGLSGCTLLALLSKANGILLPALALVIEYTLPRTSCIATQGEKKIHAYRWLLLVFAWLPTAAVAGYLLVSGWNGFVHGISSVRPWTIGERLLTEPRVLMRYLDLLWLPRPFTPGLFNDEIQASTSIGSPWTTLPALATVAVLIVGAWIFRRRWPVVATAVLFYFVGQSIESSTISLELYFEHRNYLPAMLMFWPLALWLCDVHLTDTPSAHSIAMTTTQCGESSGNFPPPGNISNPSRHKAKLMLAIVLLLGLGLMTHAGASLWGNTHDQALLWAILNPNSPRAQASAATAERIAGRPDRAAARLQQLLAKDPDQVQLALNLFNAQCQLGSIDQATLAASRNALRTTRDTGSLLVHWFEGVLEQAKHPLCPQETYQTIAGLLDAALTNPYLAASAGRKQDLYYLQGRLALTQGDANTALGDFNQALDVQVRESAALKQAALLGSAGFPKQGLAHLDYYETVRDRTIPPDLGMPYIHAWILEHEQYWPRELMRLSATLRDDAAQQAANRERSP